MRIGISGTHGVGKSTLIDEFLVTHPDFIHEPEAYTVLVEDYDEEFSAIPTVDDFRRQLEFNIERLRSHQPGERVIYERSPVDYLAYIVATDELGRERVPPAFMASLKLNVAEAVKYLDLIVFLPLESDFEVSEDEDPELRRKVDRCLTEFFDDNGFGEFGSVRVVVATGSTARRLRTIETAISQGISNTQPLDGSQRITS